MRRHLIILLGLLLPLLAQAQSSGYNPDNPPQPNWPENDSTKFFMLTCEAIPAGAGDFGGGANGRHRKGESVYVYANDHNGCYFHEWKDAQGNTLSKEHTYTLVMPDHDITIYAIYSYNPDSPVNPVLVGHYLLSLKSQPEVACTFNFKDQKVEEGSTQNLRAYGNSGFKFVNWTDEKGQVLGEDENLKFLMPAHASVLTANYEYLPEAPQEPGTNSWDKYTGELVMDYFTPGRLHDAMTDMVGGSANREKATRLIVDGVMTENDFGFTNYFTKLVYVDLSRVAGITELPSYLFDQKNTNLKEIELPSVISRIGSYAFRGCTELTIVDCYATVPPTLGTEVFKDVMEGLTVFVPEEAVDLYKKAEGWKDFTILPLRSKICEMSVTLAEGLNVKDMSLEIVNVKSGLKYKYVITDRLEYTFPNLVRNSAYNVYIKSANDKVVVQKDNVLIDDAVVSVLIDDVKPLLTLEAGEVYASDGTEEGKTLFTDQCSFVWTDTLGNVVGNDYRLTQLLEGEVYYCQVVLPEALAKQYVEPKPKKRVAGDTGAANLLNAIPKVSVSLTTKFNGSPRWNVTVDALYAGKYHDVATYSEKTSNLTFATRRVPVTVTVMVEGFKTAVYQLDDEVYEKEATYDPNENTYKLGLVYEMESLTNSVMATIAFTYKEAVDEGTETQEKDGYADYANVSYRLHNLDKLKDITSFRVDFPKLIIEEGAEAGDQIRVTASSTTGDFDDVSAVLAVGEDMKGEVTIPVVQHGGIKARFLITDNASVKALLFNSKGALIDQKLYANFNPKALEGTDANNLAFNNLASGTYTLVTMGESKFFSSIFDLNRFSDLGLEEGVDYVKNTVKIESGKIVAVRNVVVPLFDETKFYYTGQNTQFSANKANIIQGNYLTLNARIDFAEQVKGRVSEVELVFPLPLDNEFVKGSLMVGKQIAGEHQYQYVDSREAKELVDASGVAYKDYTGEHSLTVQLGDSYTDRVKFCVVPTLRGNYTPTAYVRFKLDTLTVMQPIGSAAYTVNDVTMWTPDLVSTPELHVDGNAPAFSDIYIYDNGLQIGTTRSLADGYWSAELLLDYGYPVNLSMHQIRASIVTKDGLTLQSEARFVEYNERSIQAKSVEMSFYNNGAGRTVVVGFDLQHSKATQPSYPFEGSTEFVFTADLTNNSPDVVDSCIVRVFTNNHEWIELPAKYIPNLDRWVAHSMFDMQHAPIGVRVQVEAPVSEKIDMDYLNNRFQYWNVAMARSAEPRKNDSRTDLYTIDITPVGDDKVGFEGTYFQTLLANIDASKYVADTLVIPTLKNDTMRVFIADDGSFFVNNPHDNGRVWGVDMAAEGKARGISLRETLPTDLDDALKHRIEQLQTFASIITPFTNSIHLESLWAKFKIEADYWEANPPMNDVQMMMQAQAQLGMKLMQVALENVDQISDVVKNVNLLLSYARYGINDVNDWQAFADRILPCNGLDDPQARALSWLSLRNLQRHGVQYIWSVGLATIATQVLMNTLKEGFNWKQFTTEAGWIAAYNYLLEQSRAVMDFSTNTFLQNKAASRNDLRKAKRDKNRYVNCNYDYVETIEDKWDFSLPYPIVEPIIDPSGYVYEGVSSNRLQGVTATAFYRRTYEDMYGDLQQEVVKWDAENYGQQNPLLTDEQGMYQWDVPQGEWQVKFEKEGYQTTYSEWLPVPPPQLDVNVAMTQLAQPEVVKARAFEAGANTAAGVEITFSKYMKPDMLTAENIFVKGVKDGESSLLTTLAFACPDKESAIEGSTESFARKVFVAADGLGQYDEVYVIVSSKVESYAGVPMAQTFQQKVDIERQLASLRADTLLNIGYGEQATLRIAALPTEAAAGRTVVVTTASAQVATLGEEAEERMELTLDAEGQAAVQVNAALYGSTALMMKVVDEDIKAQTMVNVVDAALLQPVKAPVASRISGTAVYRGQTVTLSCETEGATIYYTLDGSCPCDEATRRVYSAPIAINGPMTLKTMAVGYNGTESEIHEYNYLIRQTQMTVALAEGWNWASHNLADAMAVADLAEVAVQVLTETEATTIDATEAMKLKVEQPQTKQLSGDQYNPASQDITLHEGWNWLGYPVDQQQALGDALLQLPAEEGDFVTSLTGGFAEFADGQWTGILQTMMPGQGYLYKSQSVKSFVYNVPAAANTRKPVRRKAGAETPWTMNPHLYPSMMCITAELYGDDTKVEADKYCVAAFCGDELRGVSKYSNGLLYLTVYGNEGDGELRFVVADMENETQEDLLVEQTVAFSADVLGSVKAPLPLHIGSLSGINDVTDMRKTGSDAVYDLLGRRMANAQFPVRNSQSRKSLFIERQNGKFRKVVK